MYTLFKQPIVLSGFINRIFPLYDNCGREIILPVENQQISNSNM